MKLRARITTAATWITGLCVAICCASEVLSQEKGAQKPASGIEELIGTSISGVASMSYRGRWTSSDHDQDLYEYLTLDLGKAEKNCITAHISARATEDLDGKNDDAGYYVFDSITDTFDSSVNGRIYEGYADFNSCGPTERIRIGRQYLYDTPEIVHIDGASMETKECTVLNPWVKLSGGAYGGIPVHLYESSPSGDSLFGGYVQARSPWRSGRVRFDWLHVTDEDSLGTDKNDLYGISAWQGVTDYLQLHGSFTRLENKDRDLLVRAILTCAEYDLQVQASFYRLLSTLTDYSLEFDPFYFTTAFDYYPYWQPRVMISKGFGEHVRVEGGAEMRILEDDHREGEYNHEYYHFFVTPSVADLIAKGMKISLTWEIWNTTGSDDGDISTYGADISHQCTEKVKAAIGTSYSAYKYDYYSDQERDGVRTTYLKLTYGWSKAVRFDLGYEIEHDDFDDYQTVKVGARYSF